MRAGDPAATEQYAAAVLENWQQGGRVAPSPLQWTARFPVLAVDVEQQRLDSALEHARWTLDDSQQPLPPQVRSSLEDGLAAVTISAFARAVAIARSGGYA